MISRRAFVFSFLLLAMPAAGLAKAPGALQRVDKAMAFLAGSKVTRLQVEKTVTSELMGKTSVSDGEITVGSGKFRWETTSPEKSQMVYDGKIFWTLQVPPVDLGGPIQVTKTSVSGRVKDQILVKVLSSGKISSRFRLLGTETADQQTVVRLEPLKEDPTVRDFSLVIGGKPEKIREIRYKDEIGNLTVIRILNSETIKKPAAGLFKFEVPKGAQVNEL